MPRPYRVAYLVSHPIQYQAPLLRKIAALPEVDLTVFFMSDLSVRGYEDPGFGIRVYWDVPLLDGYRYEFLPVVGPRDRLSSWRPLNYGLRRLFGSGRFDALWVHGYAHHVCLRAVLAARRARIKVLVRGESHRMSETRDPLKRWAKRQLLGWLFRRVDGFLAIGTLNREYYIHYGVPERKIFMMPYAVDNEFFRKKTEEVRAHREALRAALGFQPGRPIVLYASKLQRRKRPADLLEAYIQLSPDGTREPTAYLLFVGEGEERQRLEERVRGLGWESVRFLGFKNQSELPRYYDLCDILVLPSEREPWGLVVNEVMNAGKPVIVSDQVGCGADLVRDGVNGFVFPAGDIGALADRLRYLIENPDVASRMGRKSLHMIETWSFDADIQGLLQALEQVIGPEQ
jgi:glycosyltransferase involved in cell wall biosynthesis